MRRLVILTMLFIALTADAQRIKTAKTTSDDFIPLLKMNGYNVYAFDTHKLKGKYNIKTEIKEYSNGKEVDGNANDISVSLDVGQRLVIGVMPTKADSMSKIVYHASDNEIFSLPLPLKLISQQDSDSTYTFYKYEPRPFDLADFKDGDFIPLMLYGSYWFDKDCECLRFCGDSTIKPDMSSEILKDIPHYYIIGVRLFRQ